VAEGTTRPTVALVDVDALAANVALLRQVVAPAQLVAVVKADAYGHRSPLVAAAALEAGAAGLAVALVEEGIELREAGVGGPVLVLTEPPPEAAEAVVEHDLTPTLYSEPGRAALEAAAARRRAPVGVHLKVDTGMHRVGVEPDRLLELARAVADSEWLGLEGLWTHLAVADGSAEEDRRFTAVQLARFAEHLGILQSAGLRPAVRHAANSAGAIAHPASRLDLVRVGIALYGELPSPAVAEALALAAPGAALRPVLSLVSKVVAVRHLGAGERPSYGRLRPLPTPSWVATVPVGYADGVPHRLFGGGGEVLIGGRRRPLAGAVTMDQIVVDCGPEGDVAVGDEVVLLGEQGGERISAQEWAQRTGTIAYEILTGIGARVPRVAVARDRSHPHRLGGR